MPPFPNATVTKARTQLTRLIQFAIAHGNETGVAKDCPSKRKPVSKNDVTNN